MGWDWCYWKKKDVFCVIGCELSKGWEKMKTWFKEVGFTVSFAECLLNNEKYGANNMFPIHIPRNIFA